MEQESQGLQKVVAPPAPTVGRILYYRLSASDAEQINRRRTDGPSIAKRIADAAWPLGAQAHIGNTVSEGMAVAMLVVASWGGSTVNGQAFMDGNDVLWVTSAKEGTEPGTWCWPPRV